MKATIFAFFYLVFCSQAISQASKFTVCLEYSLNFSGITNPSYGRYWFPGSDQDGSLRMANNFFLKSEYKLTRKFMVTGALGILGTREFVTNNPDLTSIGTIESNRFHRYVVTPIGFTYSIGSFFINPEIGIGWYVSSRSKDKIYLNNDGSERELMNRDELNYYYINKTSYPLFLSFGTDIKMKSTALIIGAKAYYDLNTLSIFEDERAHSYGFGLLIGVKI